MLSLHRKPNQIVTISTPDGSTIRVIVDRECKLVFDAPRAVKIVRDEARVKERKAA